MRIGSLFSFASNVRFGRRAFLCASALAIVWPFSPTLARLNTDPEPEGLPADTWVNLWHNSNGVTEFPFLNLFKLSSPWVVGKANAPYCCPNNCGQSNCQLYTDNNNTDNGWVNYLAPLTEGGNQWVTTQVLPGVTKQRFLETFPLNAPKHVRVSFVGEGTMRFDGVTNQTPPRQGSFPNFYYFVDLANNTSDFSLTITSVGTSIASYPKNISIVARHYVGIFDSGEVFNPDFLDLLRNPAAPPGKPKSVGGIRFMECLGTNKAEFDPLTGLEVLRTWANRPLVSDVRYSYIEGWPLELCVALCNKLDCGMWYTFHHTYSEVDIGHMLDLINGQLEKAPNTALPLYVEHSNEVWNPLFPQFRAARCNGYADADVRKACPTADPDLCDIFPICLSSTLISPPCCMPQSYQRACDYGCDFQHGQRWHAKRTAQIGRQLDQHVPQEDRYRQCVLGGFINGSGGSGSPNDAMLSYLEDMNWGGTPWLSYVDALAVAPYFGDHAGHTDVWCNIQSMTHATFINGLRNELGLWFNKITTLDSVMEQYGLCKQLAMSYDDKKLLCYEWGQHMVTQDCHESLCECETFLNAVQRDSAMEGLYIDAMERLYDINPDVMCHFSLATFDQFPCTTVACEAPYINSCGQNAQRQRINDSFLSSGRWGMVQHPKDLAAPKYKAFRWALGWP